MRFYLRFSIRSLSYPSITDTRPRQSTNSVVKDIVELTDGRVDLLINAAGSRGNPVLKVWDLKGSELEDEVLFSCYLVCAC